MKEYCITCKFWDAYDEEPDNVPMAQGDCHRFPPSIPIVDEEIKGVQLVTFPIMFDEEWCGEWKAREDGR